MEMTRIDAAEQLDGSPTQIPSMAMLISFDHLERHKYEISYFSLLYT